MPQKGPGHDFDTAYVQKICILMHCAYAHTSLDGICVNACACAHARTHARTRTHTHAPKRQRREKGEDKHLELLAEVRENAIHHASVYVVEHVARGEAGHQCRRAELHLPRTLAHALRLRAGRVDAVLSPTSAQRHLEPAEDRVGFGRRHGQRVGSAPSSDEQVCGSRARMRRPHAP